MNAKLINARIISFGWSFLSLLGTSLLGMLLSPEFADIVVQNFGEGFVSTLTLLVVTEVVKHSRNLSVLKKRGLGSSSSSRALDGLDVIII